MRDAASRSKLVSGSVSHQQVTIKVVLDCVFSNRQQKLGLLDRGRLKAIDHYTVRLT